VLIFWAYLRFHLLLWALRGAWGGAAEAAGRS
jgi:hypothetical protein